jgi:hypothetical protein
MLQREKTQTLFLERQPSSILSELYNKERPFNFNDAKRLVSMLQKYPNSSIYAIITGKVKKDENTPENLKETYNCISGQLLGFVQMFELYDITTFQGGQYIDSDGLRHKFSDPNPKKSEYGISREHWFHHSTKRLTNEGNWENESDDFRVYLEPKIENLLSVWTDIMMTLEQETEIRSTGYSSKIPNFFDFTYSDFPLLVNQHDKIVLYFGNQNKHKAVQVISEYVKNNQDLFEAQSFSFAQPITFDGERIKGISVADNNEKEWRTSFNNVHAKIIEKILKDICKEFGGKKLSELREEICNNTDLHRYVLTQLVSKYPEELEKKGLSKTNTAFLNKNR